MTRLRMSITFVTEYDADPDDYGTEDVAEMAEIDRAAADEDPMGFFNMDNMGDSTWTIVVEAAG